MKNILQNEINTLYQHGPHAFASHVKERICKSADISTALSICSQCNRIVNKIYLNKDKLQYNDNVPDIYSIEEAIYSILDNDDIRRKLNSLAKKNKIELFDNLVNPKETFSKFIRYSNKYIKSPMDIKYLNTRLKKTDFNISKEKLENILKKSE